MWSHLDAIDRRIAHVMERFGHPLHQLGLALLFFWFGLLKVTGYETATSLLAHTIYWGSPDVMIPLLGGWEMAIGVCLTWRPMVRLAMVLLAVRLIGTAGALILLPDTCFEHVPWVPTPAGQYLIKDFMLFSAAMVIAGTVRPDCA